MSVLSSPEAVYLGMTIAAPLVTSAQSGIWIGRPPNVLEFDVPTPGPNQIWLSVFDSSSLAQLFSYSSTDTSQVPAGILPYVGGQYFLVAASFALSSDNLPQGPLFEFLIHYGADERLRELEQISQHMGSGEISRMAYILFNGMAGGVLGLEASAIDQTSPQGAILAVGLLRATVDGVTSHTAVGLAARAGSRA